MLDSGYNEHIPGNTDKTGLVKRNLAYPVLTSKIRIYPKDFNSNIAMTARLYGYKAREYEKKSRLYCLNSILKKHCCQVQYQNRASVK